MNIKMNNNMNIKGGIRVRPLTEREKHFDPEQFITVDMLKNKVRLYDPNVPFQYREYDYDFAFWCDDDQKQVQNKIGMEVIHNALNGVSCCVVAYGQTGSGKSYTIFGGQNGENNEGLVYNFCHEIFRRQIQDLAVTMSLIQIFNEQIDDLLNPDIYSYSYKKKVQYRIREKTNKVIYVENLTKQQVNSAEQAIALVKSGLRNQLIKRTYMSTSETRINTIVSFQVKIKEINSIVHFVKFASSEKLRKTGHWVIDRSSASICKCLSTFGQVMSALACNKFIPYRDSILTRYLQSALEGNCMTYLIGVVSPSKINYQETISTMRYIQHYSKKVNYPKQNSQNSQK